MFQLPDRILAMRRSRLEAKRPLIDRFEAHVQHTEFFDLPYRLFVPERSEKPLPLIVFFHGLGEVGMDNAVQLAMYDGGTVWVQEQLSGRQEPCFVLAPQCPRVDDMRWSVDQLLCVGHLLDRLLAQYPIDPRRIYLTGLSLGGFAVWTMARLFPGRFAALVPCCPACLFGPIGQSVIRDFDILPCAEAMVQTPLWMFHAGDDNQVSVEISRRMYTELLRLGKIPGPAFHYTEYPAERGYFHACWEPAYQDQTMRDWLFRQRLD